MVLAAVDVVAGVAVVAEVAKVAVVMVRRLLIKCIVWLHRLIEHGFRLILCKVWYKSYNPILSQTTATPPVHEGSKIDFFSLFDFFRIHRFSFNIFS